LFIAATLTPTALRRSPNSDSRHQSNYGTVWLGELSRSMIEAAQLTAFT